MQNLTRHWRYKKRFKLFNRFMGSSDSLMLFDRFVRQRVNVFQIHTLRQQQRHQH